ncbi:hypothetical protein BT69DRAFT_1282562, partial [Atractiella rhizophila]
VPMPPSYSLSHPIPSFCCTLACTSWLLFHRRLLHDIEGKNEMADGERGGQSWYSRAPEPPSSIPLVSRS